MKTKLEKQLEALTRLETSMFDNSRAKRNGITIETWKSSKAREIAILTKKLKL